MLGGKVIDRARLAKFATEFSDINRAVVLFQDTYNAMPGDYDGVTATVKSTSGGADGTCATTGNANHAYSEGYWYNVCPGDGNGLVECGNSGRWECAYARNHLISDNFLNTSFSRLLQGYTTVNQASGHFPKSYGSNLAWGIFYVTGNNNTNVRNTSNVIEILSPGSDTGSFMNASLARKIDCKIDDCKPTTGVLGLLISGTSNVANCIDTGDYKTSYADQCCLNYKLE